MGDERPGCLVERREPGIPQLGAGERLPGLVDVHPGDLVHAVAGGEVVDAPQLLGGVARWHVGDGPQSALCHGVEQFVEVVVLELLGLLVAGRRGGDVTEVGVGGDRPDGVGEGHHLLGGRAFVGGGLDVDAGQVFRFQHAQQVVGQVRVVGIAQDAGEFRGYVDAHAL